MAKFWEMLSESVLIQGALVLGVTGTACYMWVMGLDVPDTLIGLLGLAWGFYFRSKASVEVKKGLGYTLPVSGPTEE